MHQWPNLQSIVWQIYDNVTTRGSFMTYNKIQFIKKSYDKVTAKVTTKCTAPH